MSEVRALLALPPARRRALVVAATMLLPVRAGVRYGSIGRVQRSSRRVAGWLLRRPPRDPIRTIPWAVTTAARHVPGARHCLTKAIVARALLEAAGLTVWLRVGVRRDEHGVLRGHAWLEGPDGVLMDAGEDPFTFVPLDELQEAIGGRN
jgi:transglutaminase superfamily protein